VNINQKETTKQRGQFITTLYSPCSNFFSRPENRRLRNKLFTNQPPAKPRSKVASEMENVSRFGIVRFSERDDDEWLDKKAAVPAGFCRDEISRSSTGKGTKSNRKGISRRKNEGKGTKTARYTAPILRFSQTGT
ncbi:hypothetical protein K0M31_001110, partial [Melipona bicolor]